MSPAEQELKNELNKISPARKAAMLLISMGVEAATPILKTMTEDEIEKVSKEIATIDNICLLYTSPSPRDKRQSRMPSSA